MARKKKALGIDVGGTGIKGAIIDLNEGELLTKRIKYYTPKPSTPAAVAKVILNIAKDAKWKEGRAIGIGFPSVVVNGKTLSAANINHKWLGLSAERYLSEKTGYTVRLVNDADAAGIAEVKYGNIDLSGTVVMLTVGTGIGSALFYNGMLVPNTEFGHMPYKRSIAEDYVSTRARRDKKMSLQKWAIQFSAYLAHMKRILTPDLVILGGGVSKRFDQFSEYLDVDVEVIPASMFNNAGIVGAALYADAHKK